MPETQNTSMNTDSTSPNQRWYFFHVKYLFILLFIIFYISGCKGTDNSRFVQYLKIMISSPAPYLFCEMGREPFWWLLLLILQNTVLTIVNQPLVNFCLAIQNQRGTKTGQSHGKIKSRTLRPKYPLWNTSVSFAKVQICPLKNENWQ